MDNLFHSNIGEIAALATAVCWTVSPIAFETAGKKVGSLSVNYIRLILAFIFIGIYTLFTRGMFLPFDASLQNWTWLFISGLIGFVIGDLFLFQAYVEIGSRLSTLIMATVPPISALAGFLILGETLSIKDLLGMFITLVGIALVILVKGSGEKKIKLSHPVKGLIYALIGAFGQAFGLIFSKFGMGNYDPFAATQIRIIAAIIGFAIVITFAKGWKNLFKACKHATAMRSITIGSLFGPFLGVSLSLLSVQYTTTGISSTITSISRILIIPASIVIFKEKTNVKEVIGALITIVGVGILFL
ncbi:DMT family transporter [Clostridium yunnanense]|uniref:DMT family transporter n=1 Tax=Clostridium yunnanense TaxID=2800325 RepID=UPI0030846B37